MSGVFCYRFADEAQAEAALATIVEGDILIEGYELVRWGPQVLTAGNVDTPAVMEANYLVFILASDPLPLEAWGQWQYEPDPWPLDFGGNVDARIASAEFVTAHPTIETGSPPRFTKEQRLAFQAVRTLRREATRAAGELRVERDHIIEAFNTLSKEVDEATALRDSLTAQGSDFAALIADLRAQDDVQVAIINDPRAGAAAKQAAREERRRLIAERDAVIAVRDSLVAQRDELIATRADLIVRRTELRDRRDTLIADLDAARIVRQAALDAIKN